MDFKKLMFICTVIILTINSQAQTEDAVPNYQATHDDFSIVIQEEQGTRNAGNDDYSQMVKDNEPISPHADAIKKFGEYPMDYSTGVPQISIPLYEIKVGNHTLPITVNYHASGIKVQEVASPVGLGWSLMAGGSIVRQAKCQIDDGQIDYKSETEIWNFYNSGSSTAIGWSYLATGQGGDTESDRYVYNFNGKSGVFRYDVNNNMNIKTIPYTPIIIEENGTGYKITDTDGTKYYFMAEEQNRGDFTYGGDSKTMAWYLTKIEFVDKNDSITFQYQQFNYYYQQYKSEYIHQGLIYTCNPNEYQDYWNSSSGDTDNSSIHTVECSNMLPTKISWRGNSVNFSYSNDRNDFVRYSSGNKLPRLTSITVKNYNNTTVRTVTFDNNHYVGGTVLSNRMFLQGLTITGSSSSSGSEVYSFTYNSITLPNYFNGTMNYPTTHDTNCHEDYWGYANNTSSTHWIPSDYAPSTITGGNRNVNQNYAKSGILECITYPTGGYTIFNFESNKLDNNTLWGGLRLNNVINYDSNGTLVNQRTYQYSGGTPAIDDLGELYHYESYYKYKYNEWLYGRLIQHSASPLHNVYVSSPVIPLTADYGCPIYYQSVTEYYGTVSSNSGKTVYTYTDNRTGDYSNYEDSNASSAEHLRTYSTTYNIDQGIISPLLTSRKVYENINGNYSLRQSENYSYEQVSLSAFLAGVRFLYISGYVPLSPSVAYPDVSDFENTYTYHNVYCLPSFLRLSSKTVKDYHAKVTTTTTYTYDSALRTHMPISESVTVSNGDILKTSYTYPATAAGTAYNSLRTANIHVPVGKKTTRGYAVVDSTRTEYGSFTSNNLLLPSKLYVAKGANTPELRLQYDYDSFGNLAYIEKDGTDKTVFLWGYKGLYPIAEITGKTKSQVYTALGSTLSSLAGTPTDAQIHGINSTLGASALVTTYTYSPLVGMTSMQSPRGEKTYFTYDGMGRVSGIADHNSHTIESYTYNYGTQNYVRKTTMTNSSGSGRVTTDYFDGMGRKSETVAAGQSPSGNDLISFVEYDAFNRPVKQYLPIAYSNSGNYLALTTCLSTANTFYNDSYPYSQTIYENCLSDKPLKQFGPGALWQNDDKAVKKEYTTNSDSLYFDCRYYDVLSSGTGLTYDGDYESGDLFVIKTTDEDENISLTFTDKEGKLILERRMKGSEAYDTYYVYDLYGNLTFVLPPEASDALSETDTNWYISTNTALRQYAYYYKYDSRNRCILKKLPGCENIQMTYDSADRLATRQDGNGNVTYYEYDNFGRQTVMGIQNSGGSNTPLVINYYDDYSSLTASGLGFNSSEGGDAAFSSARGMLTGTKVAQLDTPSNVSYTSYYYGERERLVQSHRQNHLSGYDDEYYTHNFTGTVATRKHKHSASGQTTQTELYTYTYDTADRLLNTTYKLNSDPAFTLNVNTYDNIGRLHTKHPMYGETITYDYNVRSWLTGITSTNFTETLAYNSTVNGLTPDIEYYGGNIAAMRWNTGNENFNRAFQFYYNKLGWLRYAYLTKNGNEVNNFEIEYYYDKMGNMTDFWRGGYIEDGAYNHIDMPELTLDGNQMTRVDDYDHALNFPYNKGFHFVDYANQNNEYTYDNNGNMTKDLNRRISSIQYNLLNLPQSMTYSTGGTTSYVYDATGRKLRQVYINPASTIDYCGNMIYENGSLKRIMIDGGYIEFSHNEIDYYYYLKDHQGNNRVVVYDVGGRVEVNHYYPFGLLFGESEDPETQCYKYNGKEFDRYHGLDMYDYGARFYDPSICRFTTMDPLCEKYYHLSPYIYCGNNPVNYVDPNGMDWYQDKDGTYQYSPEVHSQDDLGKGQTYLWKTKNFSKQGINFRSDGSILYNNETTAYKRMWDQADRHYRQYNKGGREVSGFILSSNKVLVLPDYDNNENSSYISHYGYRVNKDRYLSNGSENFEILGQIHTHQSRHYDPQPSYYTGDSYGDLGLSFQMGGKPVITIGWDEKIHGIYSDGETGRIMRFSDSSTRRQNLLSGKTKLSQILKLY